jgi:ADP-heptose:LPS heptosyltransferase
MTHQQRIRADRLLAAPMALVLNVFARILGRIMRRDHSMTASNVHQIIVAKLLGMGSILQATPLLKSLKSHYPGARLTFITLRSNRALVDSLEHVDGVIALDDRSVPRLAASTLMAVVAMIRLRADLYFDLEVYSAFASILAICAVVRNRIGFYRHSVKFKNGLYTHLVYFNTRISVRRLYLQLGRVVGVSVFHDESLGPICLDNSARDGMRAVLSSLPGWKQDEPYIVVNPNASELLLERRWPGKYVIESIEQLVREGHQVVLIGSSDELPFVQSLVEQLSPKGQSRAINTAGLLSLAQLLALLEGAACVVTNDTGPMHMAIALGRPTVCLFGPCSPEHYGQDLDRVEILYAPVFCSPCVHEIDVPPCNGNNICMQRIQPAMVLEAVRRLMGTHDTGKTSARITRLPLILDAPDGKPLGIVVRASIE